MTASITPLTNTPVWAFSRNRKLDQDAAAARRVLAEEVCQRLNYDRAYFCASQRKALREGFNPHDPAEEKAIRGLRSAGPDRRGEEHADSWQQTGSRPITAGHGNAAQESDARRLAVRAKWLGHAPHDTENRKAISKLAEDIAGRGNALLDFSWRDSADLANGFSKFVKKERRESLADDGLVAIAEAVGKRTTGSGLQYASAVDMSLLANAFSKLAGEAGDPACNAALALLAGEVQRRSRDLKDFGVIALSNLANAFSKLAGEGGDPACDTALGAEAVGKRTTGSGLQYASAVDMSLLANAFSKLAGEAGDPACDTALGLLAGEVQRRSGQTAAMPAAGVARRVGEKSARQEEQERRVRPRIGDGAGQASRSSDGVAGTGGARLRSRSWQ
jgi:hypothetical protein